MDLILKNGRLTSVFLSFIVGFGGDNVTVLTKKRLKPMMSIDDMIISLKAKNIKFNYISEDEVKNYLMFNNSYYNVLSYEGNFMKYPSPAGKYEGMFIDLDFAYLKDMSIIDLRVRFLLLDMILDIEHYLKLRILNMMYAIEQEDGYRVVNLYLENDYNNEKRLHSSIRKKAFNSYYRKMFSDIDMDDDKKLEDIPIWDFLEIATLGELVDFYDFFTKEYDLKIDKEYVHILRDIVRLRNAAGHNTNVLTDLGESDKPQRPHMHVIRYLDRCGIRLRARYKRLSNSKIRQITYTLYMFNKIVTSEGVKKKINKKINYLFYKRIPKNKDYYKNNDLLKSIYYYFDKIISIDYNPKKSERNFRKKA